MTTATDIANRALQKIGTRTNVTTGELGAGSTNEAVQFNLCYAVVVDWCHAVTNWNFARKTAALTLLKTVTLPPTTWTSSSPAPPWINEYGLPSDFIHAQYLTNNGPKADASAFLGEPQRFVIATDTITGVQQSVLLTDQAAANLVYTSRVIDPTLWPAYFERFVVSVVAHTISYALTGDKNLEQTLEHSSLNHFSAAETINRQEGLQIVDTTPEMIQAIGLPYPYRRYNDMKPTRPQSRQPDDNNNN